MSESNPIDSVPKKMRPVYEQVVAQTDAFCKEHLTEDYAGLCRDMAAELCRVPRSPLAHGKPVGWAAGILWVVGRANFLGDPSQTPHMKLADIGPKMGVGSSTAAAKAKVIREFVHTGPLELRWQTRSMLEDNPLTWMIEIDGLPYDVRELPREVQEVLHQRGIIPFVPGEKPGR